jgi:hypothetical protein
MSDDLEDDTTSVSDYDSDEQGRKYIIEVIRDVFIPAEGFRKIIKSLFKEYAFSKRENILYLVLPDKFESQSQEIIDDYTQKFRKRYIRWYKTYECGTLAAIHVDAVMEVTRVVFINPEDDTPVEPGDIKQILKIVEDLFKERTDYFEKKIERMTTTMEERFENTLAKINRLKTN